MSPRVDERKLEWEDDAETEAAALAEAASSDPSDVSASPAQEMFLIVKEGVHVSLVDLHEGGEWVIGRGKSAQIVADDQTISRMQAKISYWRGALALEDLGSRNGTLVNGRVLRGASVRIGTGDVVEAGACQIVVASRAGRVSARTSSGAAGDEVDVVVADPEMARIYASARKVARLPTTVLILGETGVGKDVLAQRIHQFSARAGKPFVRINCAGIPESLLESELFGHERGAFTGADRRKIGYFEAAHEGTVFLDEIGELSAMAQAKLLHVLENRTVTRLGGTAPVPLDVRIVCATHRDLHALVAEERFRSDLFYRISPFVLRVPPLRARLAEVPLLARIVACELAEKTHSPPPDIAPDALAMLSAYPWPGNVRELRNSVEHAFVMAEGRALCKEHFAPEIRALARASRSPMRENVREKLRDVERSAIEEAIAIEGGNQTRAAVRLGIPRRTLVHKLTQYRKGRERS